MAAEFRSSVHEVPSGTRVLDWTVPDEWTIRDAYVARNGERVIDFRRSNLHVVSYSEPIRAVMPLAELRPHLHTLPEHPDWIPYRTSYYARCWGFCLTQRQLDALADGDYEVVVDSVIAPGSLTYGECVLPGRSTDEVLADHPCLPPVARQRQPLWDRARLPRSASSCRRAERALTYRLLFIPGTIGSITWLARSEAASPGSSPDSSSPASAIRLR